MNNINSILQLINPDNTITANRAFAHAIGMTETIIYSALISKYSYYESKEMLSDEKWFYCTAIDLQESTTFPPKLLIDIDSQASLSKGLGIKPELQKYLVS